MRVGRRLARGKALSNRHALVGSPALWQMKRSFQFEFLSSRGLRTEHRLLDIGCGTLRGGIPLIDYLETGHYIGVEARAEALEEAHKELKGAGLEHKRPLLIHASDPGQVKLEAPVDVAWAFAVLFHMPDEVLDACLGLVSRSLTEGGELYANVKLGDRHDGAQWREFPIVRRPRDFYQSLAATHGLSMSELGTLHSIGHQTGISAHDDQMMLRFSRISPIG
jgi:cyclopropane fatty-acyl-phospholipid synthase-like methyltransferase